MCDTLGLVSDSLSLFAKNSDRSPNEVQVLEYRDSLLHFMTDMTLSFEDRRPTPHESRAMQKLTYCSVEQVPQTRAVLLSRPRWMWGAEMGVNDCGVCIGNEAVFTRGRYGRDGLTGMDLVRLALERTGSAKEALELIVSFLQRYGQGGNCGYDHEFYYDNAFLIMDRRELYVLETAGKEWAWKKQERASISNRLSLGDDCDAYSGKPCNFAAKYTEPLYSTFSGARRRRQQTGECLSTAGSASDMMRALRRHDKGVENPFAQGSVSSPCMHFGGLVGDHSTASMVVELQKERTVVWSTGSSAPCVSLYKPWLFGSAVVSPIYAPGELKAELYWREQERFRRSLLGKKLPEDFYGQRDALECSWIAAAATCADGDFPELSRKCAVEEQAFYDSWRGYEFEKLRTAPGFMSRWEKKNSVFLKESENID